MIDHTENIRVLPRRNPSESLRTATAGSVECRGGSPKPRFCDSQLLLSAGSRAGSDTGSRISEKSDYTPSRFTNSLRSFRVRLVRVVCLVLAAGLCATPAEAQSRRTETPKERAENVRAMFAKRAEAREKAIRVQALSQFRKAEDALKDGASGADHDLALFRLGTAAETLQRWDVALDAYEKLAEKGATPHLVGEGWARRVQLTLEKRVDFPTAERLDRRALLWAIDAIEKELETQDQGRVGQGSRDEAQGTLDVRSGSARREETFEPPPPVEPRTVGPLVVEIYRRHALILWLRGADDPAETTQESPDTLGRDETGKSGDALDPEIRQRTPAEWFRLSGMVKNGGPIVPLKHKVFDKLDFLLQQDAADKLVPDAAKKGDANAARFLRLAVLFERVQGQKEMGWIADGLLAGKGDFELSDEQKSLAHLLRGRARLADRWKRNRAKGDLLAAQQIAPDAPWAGFALFLAGNLVWNLDRDVKAADEAIRIWQRQIKTYPDEGLSVQSAYRIGRAYSSTRRFDEAKRAFEFVREKYPESPYNARSVKRLEAMQKADR